jgi:PEP-CTERM motif
MKPNSMRVFALAALAFCGTVRAASAATLLYDQDFENPIGFVNDGGDINIFRPVNDLYGDQPPGFLFAQPFTTETLRIGGTEAFGVGYTDPSNIGGSFVVAMLSDSQNDYLSLSFDVGAFRFLNIEMDISSIDLDRFGGPFVPEGGLAPIFEFTLFDNPGGAVSLSGNGVALDSFQSVGLLNPSKTEFLWSSVLGALDATGNSDGNVTLRIDLLQGGYAAFDNIRVAAADDPNVIPTPEPATLAILGVGLLGSGLLQRRRRF